MNKVNFQRGRREVGPRKNEQIKLPEIQVINSQGQNIGVIATKQALQMAREEGLDLIEINATSTPSVCKIMDYGKWKYEQKKKASENKKKTKIIEVKELQFRFNIEEHDYNVKLKHLEKFISKGDKVKVVIRFRGRELQQKEVAKALLQRIENDVKEYASVELAPKFEGRQMLMIFIPVK